MGCIICGADACFSGHGEDSDALVPVTVDMAKKFTPRSVNEIAVLPFDAAYGQKMSEADLTDAERRLLNSVGMNTTLQLRNASDPEGVKKTIAKYIPRRGTAREQAVYVGRDLGVQAVLYGVLSNYTELAGSRLGSETSAAVSCTLWLVDTQSGEVLWSARFADTDRPLFENIFRYRRRLSPRMGNSTASEMLEAGFKEALHRLETARTAN